MTAYEQIHKAYWYAQKNNFWDAWGVVVSPRMACELRVECMERMVVYTDNGVIEVIFGLRLIPCDIVENDKVYIVDEPMGRAILERERSKYEYRQQDKRFMRRPRYVASGSCKGGICIERFHI